MATLKSLVDETTDIKDELKACHSNLKNTLIEKGVECSDNDKMSSLIDKVGDVEQVNKVIASSKVLINANLATYTSTGTAEEEVYAFYMGLVGSVRISAKLRSTGALNTPARMVFRLTRNGKTTYASQTFATNNSQITASYDFNDVQNGDLIKVAAWSTDTYCNTVISNLTIGGDII